MRNCHKKMTTPHKPLEVTIPQALSTLQGQDSAIELLPYDDEKAFGQARKRSSEAQAQPSQTEPYVNPVLSSLSYHFDNCIKERQHERPSTASDNGRRRFETLVPLKTDNSEPTRLFDENERLSPFNSSADASELTLLEEGRGTIRRGISVVTLLAVEEGLLYNLQQEQPLSQAVPGKPAAIELQEARPETPNEDTEMAPIPNKNGDWNIMKPPLPPTPGRKVTFARTGSRRKRLPKEPSEAHLLSRFRVVYLPKFDVKGMVKTTGNLGSMSKRILTRIRPAKFLDRLQRRLSLVGGGIFQPDESMTTQYRPLTGEIRRPGRKKVIKDVVKLNDKEYRVRTLRDANSLSLNAAAPEYDSVIILAHSMGGLLAVDAFRKLYDSDKEWISEEPSTQTKRESPPTDSGTKSSSWFGFWSGSGELNKSEVKIASAKDEGEKEETQRLTESTGSLGEEKEITHEKHQDPQTLGAEKPLLDPAESTRVQKSVNSLLPEVNIVAIVSFDSPFFGLHPEVYTSAAPTHAANLITPYVPTIPTPSLPSLPNVSGTIRSATASVSEKVQQIPAAASTIPSAAWDAASSLPSAAAQLPSAVSKIPIAAAEGAATIAKGATAAVSYLPSAATQAAAATLRATTAAVTQASTFTASKVVGITEAIRSGTGSPKTIPGSPSGSETPTTSRAATEQKIASTISSAALGALPGVAVAGAAAAVSAMPGAIGLAASVIPRITWGRMAFAGASAMVAATVVGAKVIHDKETAKQNELLYLVEDAKTGGESKKGPFDDEENLQGFDPLETNVSEKGLLKPSLGETTILFESTDDPDSDPKVSFEVDGQAALAETAGLETATLIAAAALAHSLKDGECPELKDQTPSASPGTSPRTEDDVLPESGPDSQANTTLDDKARTILKKTSNSLLKAAAAATKPESTASETDASKGVVLDQKHSVEESMNSETAPAAASSSWMPWLTVGLAGAAIAAGTYYTGGLLLAAPLVQSVAVTWAASHVNEASRHLQFLYPLWGETQKDWMRRLEILQGEVGVGRLSFRCFYIEVIHVESRLISSYRIPLRVPQPTKKELRLKAKRNSWPMWIKK
ncbi:hypothetical protein HDU96_004056 [Phlyctochytrium bullatum]|nr:hypothetical protein HDU96_004056 [Phlyctochytrium bullatum]